MMKVVVHYGLCRNPAFPNNADNNAAPLMPAPKSVGQSCFRISTEYKNEKMGGNSYPTIPAPSVLSIHATIMSRALR
jgi:hypothetical protein